MRCSKCGADNRQGRKFCAECGAPLAATCAKCGAVNEPNEKFCGECGAGLGETAGPKQPQVTPIAASANGERRHLTVLFCDLVGSSEIAAQLDPEEWREVVASYHRSATKAITRFGGYVAHYLGDGVMAYFGWPEAHDNDAERAARAGLAILEAIAKLNSQPAHAKLAARVGIDSGVVVVGASAGQEADVFGDVPNIAARVQSAAAPDSVLITGATHRLLSGLFVVEERGAQELKGVGNPVELYRVLRSTGVRGRLAVARGLTPFVGREGELRLLIRRWESARESEGQLVLVVGEAGIGKSRLVAEFHDRIRDAPHIWMESAGDQFFQNTPFHAISEMLSQWLELQGDTNPDDRTERLERALASAGLKPEDSVALIADLLQPPVGERYPAIALTPEQRRRRLLAALTGWVFGAARLQPVVMVIEDLHWLDPSTLELLQLLAGQGVMVPLMLICTARPEFHPQWPMRSHHTQITLNRLSGRNVREMVAQVAARNALNNQSIDAVIERTGGNPLFVEELTRAVLESGGIGARAIPVTLHDSLMARLDRLGSAKSVLQLASVIGGEFSYELLHALHPGTESELESELHKLTDADLLYFRGIAPEATYQFKHALIRDAAYEALLKSRRKELHRLVARTIDEKFPDLKQAHPEVLARHWSEAGEVEPAIAEWERAGKAAEARSAFQEARTSYREVLDLVSLLPGTPSRDARELELVRSLHRILYQTKGLAASETMDVAERLISVAEKTGNLVKLGGSLTGKGFGAFFSGDLSGAIALADQALAIAVRARNPSVIANVRFLQMAARCWRGDLAGAQEQFTAGLEFFDDPDFRQLPGVVTGMFSVAAKNTMMLGRPDASHQFLDQMTAIAEEKHAPTDIALARLYSAMVRVDMREFKQAETLAAQALDLSEKHQFAHPIANSRCILGYARAQLGETNEGIAIIRQGIGGLPQAGSLGISRFKTFLAEALERAGMVEEALETIEQALSANTLELSSQPEALRVRGELRLKQWQTDKGESDFQESIALARKMGAKAWELRTTMSLARLLKSQGRRHEARVMLSDIYNWFTEGFDTVDLKEAKALLDELVTE